MVLTRCVVLAFIAALCVAEEWPTAKFVEALKPAIEKCQVETGVDPKIVEDFSKGIMADDDKLKCYMKCIFVHFGVLNEQSGIFHFREMLIRIPEEMKKIAFEMGKNCIHFRGEDDSNLCEISYNLHKCWQQADPEHYFLM